MGLGVCVTVRRLPRRPSRTHAGGPLPALPASKPAPNPLCGGGGHARANKPREVADFVPNEREHGAGGARQCTPLAPGGLLILASRLQPMGRVPLPALPAGTTAPNPLRGDGGHAPRHLMVSYFWVNTFFAAGQSGAPFRAPAFGITVPGRAAGVLSAATWVDQRTCSPRYSCDSTRGCITSHRAFLSVSSVLSTGGGPRCRAPPISLSQQIGLSGLQCVLSAPVHPGRRRFVTAFDTAT